MPLPIKEVRNEPRANKRRIWKNWWKYRRDEIPGKTREEKRQNWYLLWEQIAHNDRPTMRSVGTIPGGKLPGKVMNFIYKPELKDKNSILDWFGFSKKAS